MNTYGGYACKQHPSASNSERAKARCPHLLHLLLTCFTCSSQLGFSRLSVLFICIFARLSYLAVDFAIKIRRYNDEEICDKLTYQACKVPIPPTLFAPCNIGDASVRSNIKPKRINLRQCNFGPGIIEHQCAKLINRTFRWGQPNMP